jgi:transcription elongation factor Elf1
MDKKGGTGTIHCKVCGQDWSTNINCMHKESHMLEGRRLNYRTVLSAPVDVYADWVDACDEAAKAAATGGESERSTYREQPAPAPKVTNAPGGPSRTGGTLGEMDGFLDDDEADAEGDFMDDD